MDNIVRVAFSGSSRFSRTIPVTRQDRGVWLLFENVDVPDTFQVHFSHTRANNGTAKTWMGTKENGVLIPDEYLASGETVYAWIFVQEDDSGMTKYMAEIQVHSKPTVTDDPPTPVQESAWDQAIEELNGVLDDAKSAVSHYPMIQDGTWWVWDVDAQKYVNTGYAAAGRDGLDGLDGRDGRDGSDGKDGEKGDKGVTYTPVVDANGVISWTNDGNLPNPQPRNITGPQGERGPEGIQGEKGPKGDTGNRGEKGERGDPFVYEDFTPAQLAELKGPKGDTGPKGDAGEKGEAFTYEDFTPAQLEALRGPQGAQGATGPKGDKGDTGETGPQGQPGQNGAPGTPGEDGKSAYESAVDGGYNGTESQFNSDLAGIGEKLGPSALTSYRTAAAQDEIDAGKEAAGLGLTGASVGDLVRVNAVDATGKPTSWKHVPLNEIKCNKNYLINHYMGGGGSQRTDKSDCLPINQRGQTNHSGVGYGLDMWTSTNSNCNVELLTNALRMFGTNGENNWLHQKAFCVNPDFLIGKQITVSILFSNGELSYATGILPINRPTSGTAGFSSNGVRNIGIYERSTGEVFAQIGNTSGGNLDFIDCKLELGSEQTLCHNEGTDETPVWVLNEIPDYDEELRNCQLYFERFKKQWGCIGIGHAETASRGVLLGNCHPKKQGINYDTTNVLTGNAYVLDSVNQGVNLAVSRIAQFVVLPSGSFSANFYVDGSQLVADRPCRLQFRDSTSYIDISCEP